MTVVRSKFLLTEGGLQNQDGVIHVKATPLPALVDGANDPMLLCERRDCIMEVPGLILVPIFFPHEECMVLLL